MSLVPKPLGGQPEQNLLIFKEDEAAFLERAKRLARDEHVYLAMGMSTIYQLLELGVRLWSPRGVGPPGQETS